MFTLHRSIHLLQFRSVKMVNLDIFGKYLVLSIKVCVGSRIIHNLSFSILQLPLQKSKFIKNLVMIPDLGKRGESSLP